MGEKEVVEKAAKIIAEAERAKAGAIIASPHYHN